MGILDQVKGAIGGAQGGGVKAILAQQVISMLSKPGALGKLTESFQQNGLGNILQSWLGSGQNLPISGAQVQQVLGNDNVNEMAKKAGVDASEASNQLSELLPDVVDKASPDGKAPDENQFSGMLSSVGKMFGGRDAR